MKLLFITHNTALAGAPKVLLLFLQWLATHQPAVEIHVLDMAPCGFAPAFKACSKNYYTFPKKKKEKGFRAKVLKKIGLLGKEKDAKAALLHTLRKQNFDVVYANTIKTVPLAVQIKMECLPTKLVLHLHELPTVITLLLPDFENYTTHIDGYIAVSELVKSKLIEKYSISATNIQTVYAFSETVATTVPRKTNKHFHVGASGFVDWRKGYDIFIQVAHTIAKQAPTAAITFTWVGALPKETQLILEADLEKLGLQERVHFVGLQENPWPYYSHFDVFLLPSREDPFPLVVIEMAQLAIPIICFENAVGTSEILINGGGKIVPYLDIEAMAQAVLDYVTDRHACAADGKKAFQLFKNFTPEVQCPKIYKALEMYLEKKTV